MDDRRGVPLTADLAAAFHSEPVGRHGSGPRQGFFIALEGGEGAGKSTQARALADWLRVTGPRRRGDLRARCHRGRSPAAFGAARPSRAGPGRHRSDASRPVRQDRGTAVRGRPGRARRHRGAAGAGAGSRRGLRPLHRLVGRLPGCRPRAGRRRGRAAVPLGHRRSAAAPHRRPRRARRRRPRPGRGSGPAGVGADGVPRAGPRAVPRAGSPRRRRATWSSTGRCRRSRSPRRSGPGSRRCCR